MEADKLVANELSTKAVLGVVLRDVKIAEQGSLAFTPLIKKHSASIFICGYLSPVIAIHARGLLEKEDKKPKELILEMLAYCDSDAFLKDLDQSFGFIQTLRKSYIDSHPNDFPDSKSQSDYISDLVAGFEVSSFFEKTSAPSDLPICLVRNVCFDYPELMKHMKHEELEKSREQEPFKGKKFFIELFLKGKRELLEPRALLKSISGAKAVVLLVEFLGHFCSGVFFPSTPDRPKSQIVFLDTSYTSELLLEEFHIKFLVSLFLKF